MKHPINTTPAREGGTLAGRCQRGFTLVEMMVAMVIALFLLTGLLASVQSTRRAYGNQNLMAQLQDNERLAMSLMASTIESAGYFPKPYTYTNTGVLVSDALFPIPGQIVVGATGDTISVRNAPAANENVYSCNGQKNTTAPYGLLESTFKVVGNQFVCTYLGVNYPLINSQVVAGVTTLGVTSMTILYGIKTPSAGDTGSCADSYWTAAQVQNTLGGPFWSQVCSVYVTLNFINPLKPGTTIAISRTIAVMNTAGANT
jgi:type IV pilus assembly protein PilW